MARFCAGTGTNPSETWDACQNGAEINHTSALSGVGGRPEGVWGEANKNFAAVKNGVGIVMFSGPFTASECGLDITRTKKICKL